MMKSEMLSDLPMKARLKSRFKSWIPSFCDKFKTSTAGELPHLRNVHSINRHGKTGKLKFGYVSKRTSAFGAHTRACWHSSSVSPSPHPSSQRTRSGSRVPRKASIFWIEIHFYNLMMWGIRVKWREWIDQEDAWTFFMSLPMLILTFLVRYIADKLKKQA